MHHMYLSTKFSVNTLVESSEKKLFYRKTTNKYRSHVISSVDTVKQSYIKISLKS